jgi:S1-C subfamily serine protease
MTYADNSRNGTIVNGRPIKGVEIPVDRDTAIVFPNGIKLDWRKVPAFASIPNLKKQLTIGKDASNDIKIYADNISRHHAILKITNNNKYFLFDQSLNGTTVNGTRIPKFTDVEIKRGTKVFFANSQALDWTYVPGTDRKRLWVILLLLIFVVTASAAYNYYNPALSIAKRYENSVGLIYNSYYLAYVDRGDTLYYIGSNGIADVRNNPSSKDTLKPYATITGSGFYVSNDGRIITNKHVAVPWESELDSDRDTIEQAINLFRLKYKSEIPSGIKIVGVSAVLGIFPNASYFDKNNPLKNMRLCKFVKAAPEKEIDLAVIQLQDEKLPPECTAVTNIIQKKEEINVDDEVTMIGYPFGLDLALKNNESKIKSTDNHGKVSKISDKYEVQYDIASYHGASGSPVFNKDGVLVAVNYLGNEKVSGYNFGIIAVYIRKLLEE